MSDLHLKPTSSDPRAPRRKITPTDFPDNPLTSPFEEGLINLTFRERRLCERSAMSPKDAGQLVWDKALEIARYLALGLSAIGCAHYMWPGDGMISHYGPFRRHPEGAGPRPSAEESRLWAGLEADLREAFDEARGDHRW
ncbi:hypothetical protein [Sphaerisporangium dianthi]|uniref:Uncharacterized protein n=1 Tax=Sphaerisporangium dianthi TaxID=1436120 RepID=A0ABV9CJ23_9ACTN